MIDQGFSFLHSLFPATDFLRHLSEPNVYVYGRPHQDKRDSPTNFVSAQLSELSQSLLSLPCTDFFIS